MEDFDEVEEGGGPFDRPYIRTRLRGTLEQEYEIYKANAESLGWDVKTFDEWLGS
jgi:hypothetical protein